MPSRGSAGGAVYMAWDTSANAYKTGDSANHTLRFVKDATEATPTNSPTEVDSTNAPGAYSITWTSAEGTCNVLWIGGKSATASIFIIPITIGFENLPTAAPGASNGLITVGSGAGQLNMASGFGYTNLQQWEGLPPLALSAGLVQATIAGVTSSAQFGVNVVTWAGDPVTFPAALGTPSVNTTKIGGTVTSTSAAFLGVNLVTWEGDAPSRLIGGLVQSTFSGTVPAVNVTQWLGQAAVADGNNLPSMNVVDIAGAAANTAAAQLGVNVVNWAGAGANALISGRVDSIANQVGTNAIGAGARVAGSVLTTAFPSNWLTSAIVDVTAENAIADALGNRANAIETGLTPYQAWRLTGASQGGQLSGAGTTQIGIWGAGVTTTRISAVTDQSGNRSSVTLNL